MNSSPHRRIGLAPLLLVLSVLAVVIAASAPRRAATAMAPEPGASGTAGWRTDPAWYDGKAEWALYAAERPIYGAARGYEATIYTNKQRMDPGTTTKAEDWRDPASVEVFKHNLSEMIPTENYTYRFLTTCFLRTADLAPFKVVMSSQEDCGTTYKEFRADGGRVRAREHCYFPGGGEAADEYAVPADLRFHDALSLTLRDYPFDAVKKPVLSIDLVPDQTDTHETSRHPAPARVEHVGRETLDLPYGRLDAHHLRVTHDEDGGRTKTDLWFAADPGLRRVMVKYEGPYGVRYELKKLGWWAYWDRGAKRPG